MQEFDTLPPSKTKHAFAWPQALKLSLPLPIPGRLRSSRRTNSKRRSRYPKPEDISALQRSFSPLDGVKALRQHRFSLFDLQYVFLASLSISSLFIIGTSAPLIKTGVVVAYSLLLLMPATRQFFLPSWPIWVYLLYFFSSRFIPNDYRPHIWVKVLPALENVLYGANLSNILSAHTHPVLDLLAWIPYGLGHFGNPAICSVLIFLFAAPGTLPRFARSFGWLSILGVTMALVFPCTPPWYENQYGLAPAHYGMPGSPAGLARVDALLGVDMYTTSFSTAPVPFGAFPSLHAADATLEALFMSHCFPRLRPLFIFYVGWLWWATMYLSHHYAVDLVGGSLIAAVIFYTVKARWLPVQQHDKKNRWAYDFTEIGEMKKSDDVEYGYGYGLGLLEPRNTGDSDEWTLGSSSSFSSTSRASGSGPSSPITPDDHSGRVSGETLVASMSPGGLTWDDEIATRSSEV